ncbi:hypothetical protein [Halobacterium salinarum]|uniref:Uncharacterized protein n=1 Tax=Halobacterium salinarum (strain ATCC 33171 / DSM 3754 / JCM 8978 / NBRC 102687 / NCIMB 764 / 91-R6) TaxID=2597657 RepID=A0A4D6GQK2_HALS9|nr:hypothetical protein [Halobacterium salinarum]QCC43980.1 uncharacterized protein HBSAL_01180 [Halobacterium salinarum]TYO82474.1 hypothetical protein APQ99_01005 [Halobacterium salinarum DSM 3754]
MSDDLPGIVVRPGLKLEDVREQFDGNEPYGRGRETAAPRGYNAERLATALVSETARFEKWSPGPWVDAFVPSPSGISCYLEVKTTIDQYPSQTPGRFRIWGPHHHRLLASADVYEDTNRLHLYLFVVYTIDSGIEREIGKLVVPAIRVDDHIDTWALTDHDTMGEQLTYTISWRALLDALGVSHTAFINTDTTDLTVDSENLQRARKHTEA